MLKRHEYEFDRFSLNPERKRISVPQYIHKNYGMIFQGLLIVVMSESILIYMTRDPAE